MHRTFEHAVVKEESDVAWTAATKQLAVPFKPTGKAIQAWLDRMDMTVNSLIDAGVNEGAINTVIIGQTIAKFQKFKDLTFESQRWMHCGTDYRNGHSVRPYTWTTLSSVIAEDVQKDALDNSDDEGISPPGCSG